MYTHDDIVSTLPLGILSIVLISVVVMAALVGLSVLCCCFCCKCCQGEEELEDQDEDRPLLGSKYLRRSSTYYQWNRQPVVPHNKADDAAKNTKKLASQSASSLPVDQVGDAASPTNSSTIAENWEDRRTALLKKYAKEEPTTTSINE